MEKKRKFDILFESIITEMTEDGFYPAKYIDGTQAVGKNFRGDDQIWMIGPVKERHNRDFFTKEKLPWMATCLWLPDKIGPRHGILISINSYENVKAENPEKLEELGLIKDIDWENA